jgi:hypothetical protein
MAALKELTPAPLPFQTSSQGQEQKRKTMEPTPPRCISTIAAVAFGPTLSIASRDVAMAEPLPTGNVNRPRGRVWRNLCFAVVAYLLAVFTWLLVGNAALREAKIIPHWHWLAAAILWSFFTVAPFLPVILALPLVVGLLVLVWRVGFGRVVGALARKPLVLALASCAFGALLVFVSFHLVRAPVPVSTAPKKFIPNQTLRLLDQNRAEFGDIYIGSEPLWMISLRDLDGAQLATLSPNSHGTITLYGRESGMVFANMMWEESLFVRVYPPGREETSDFESPPLPARQQKGLVSDTLDSAGTIFKAWWTYFFPEKLENDLDSLIPTQDWQLTDKDGRTIAVLGLAEGGFPSAAFLDGNGTVVALWDLSEKAFSSMELVDSRGKIRFAAEFRPLLPPRLTLFEAPDFTGAGSSLGAYTIDPNTYGKVPFKNPFFPTSEDPGISWLRFPTSGIAAPIVLVDERDREIWKAP